MKVIHAIGYVHRAQYLAKLHNALVVGNNGDIKIEDLHDWFHSRNGESPEVNLLVLCEFMKNEDVHRIVMQGRHRKINKVILTCDSPLPCRIRANVSRIIHYNSINPVLLWKRQLYSVLTGKRFDPFMKLGKKWQALIERLNLEVQGNDAMIKAHAFFMEHDSNAAADFAKSVIMVELTEHTIERCNGKLIIRGSLRKIGDGLELHDQLYCDTLKDVVDAIRYNNSKILIEYLPNGFTLFQNECHIGTFTFNPVDPFTKRMKWDCSPHSGVKSVSFDGTSILKINNVDVDLNSCNLKHDLFMAIVA